jgi:saccharopine dehydrogenase (NAD+, L-lysine-forming)
VEKIFYYIFMITGADNMDAVVLGGAGVIGSYVVKCLSQSDVFSNVYLADYNEEKAKEISKRLSNVDYRYLDATDGKSLHKSLEGADIAVNCIGPFYKFAPLILKTAIERGVDYVDVCDDYDITQTLLDDFHKQAVDAGVTCIVGLGASPGLTNVIAAFAAEELSSVKDIRIYVTRGIAEEAGEAIPYHMLHCWLGEIPIYKNGVLEKAKGLVDGEEYVTFPEPFGQAPVYYFGHPETVTIPRYIKGVNNVWCKGTFFPPEFRQALVQIESLGLISETPINVKGYEVTPLDFLASYVASMAQKLSMSGLHVPSGGAVMVEVSGEKDSQPKTYRFAGTSHMREGTATPAALAARMIAQDQIYSPGVQAPEGCVPPKIFLNFLLKEKLFGDVWMTVTEKITGRLP